MALLTAKQDPAVVFADIDTSQAAGQSAQDSYQRISSTKAVFTLQSLSGIAGQVDGQDFELTLFGNSLPASLTVFSTDLLNATISKVTLARKGAPADVLFSWDGQGQTIKLTQLGQAVQSGNQDTILNLFLSGTDTLLAEYENVNIESLTKLENVTLTGSNKNLTGNAVDNVLKGNAQNNDIKCGAGNDQAFGFDGNDTLAGGDGNDRLTGGKGDDLMLGALLNDLFAGEEGADAMRGGNGRDTLSGGSGRDEMWSDFGRNQFLANNDGESDLLVIKADQLLLNPLFGNVDTSNGTRCDLIGKIDATDKIIIQGATTAQLDFQAGFSWQEAGPSSPTYTGIAILAQGKLEALYVGGDLNLEQLKSITSGDASPGSLVEGFLYGTW